MITVRYAKKFIKNYCLFSPHGTREKFIKSLSSTELWKAKSKMLRLEMKYMYFIATRQSLNLQESGMCNC